MELMGDLLVRGVVTEGGAISIGEGKGEPYMFGGNSYMTVSEKTKKLGWTQKEKDPESLLRDGFPKK